mgnify:CR=1 FL=1
MEQNNNRPYPTVTVKVELKPEMRTKDTTKWLCTINGERRVVTAQRVQWECTSLKEASESIREKELIRYEIIGGVPKGL